MSIPGGEYSKPADNLNFQLGIKPDIKELIDSKLDNINENNNAITDLINERKSFKKEENQNDIQDEIIIINVKIESLEEQNSELFKDLKDLYKSTDNYEFTPQGTRQTNPPPQTTTQDIKRGAEKTKSPINFQPLTSFFQKLLQSIKSAFKTSIPVKKSNILANKIETPSTTMTKEKTEQLLDSIVNYVDPTKQIENFLEDYKNFSKEERDFSKQAIFDKSQMKNITKTQKLKLDNIIFQMSEIDESVTAKTTPPRTSSTRSAPTNQILGVIQLSINILLKQVHQGKTKDAETEKTNILDYYSKQTPNSKKEISSFISSLIESSDPKTESQLHTLKNLRQDIFDLDIALSSTDQAPTSTHNFEAPSTSQQIFVEVSPIGTGKNYLKVSTTIIAPNNEETHQDTFISNDDFQRLYGGDAKALQQAYQQSLQTTGAHLLSSEIRNLVTNGFTFYDLLNTDLNQTEEMKANNEFPPMTNLIEETFSLVDEITLDDSSPKLGFYSQQGLSLTAAEEPANRVLNRYRNILPTDQSRVTLKDGKYINASFVHDPSTSERPSMIATQGPLPHTLGDFARMLVEQNTQKVFCLTRVTESGRRKVEPYFELSSLTDQKQLGDYTFKLDSSEVPNPISTDTTDTRKIIITYKEGNVEKTHTITHIHYKEWPDNGVPQSPQAILALLEQLSNNPETPDVIHCSAGIGRTGVMCLLQESIKKIDLLSEEELVTTNILNLVSNLLIELRKERPGLVQTEEQFEFVIRTLQEYYKQRMIV